MNMLLETLNTVGSHPVPWIVVAFVILGALAVMRKRATCPHLRGTATVSYEEAKARLDQPFVAGAGYAFTIVIGIAAMVTGLAMIANSIAPVAAFVVLSAGIVTVQIAPHFLRLREGYDRVIAARAEGPDALAFARERVEDTYTGLIAMSVGIAVVLSLGLLVS
ncbi:MAG: hypothetical protein AAFS07_01190 [Pseudomonadota bacterium]